MAEIIHLRPARAPHPQAPAGVYGWPEPQPITERARVDVSGCADGYRVWLFGRPYKDFATLTNATRCAAALTTLDALDALPPAAAGLEAKP